MPDVLVAATILSLLFAVLMTVIAAKLLRESRARTTSRVEALQALAAGPAAIAPRMSATLETAATLPVPAAAARTMPVPTPQPHMTAASAPDDIDDSWDFDLRDEFIDAEPIPAPRSTEPAPRHVRTAAPPSPHGYGEQAFDVRTFEQAPLRSSNVDVRSSNETHELFEAPVPVTPSRRWTWMAAAGVVMLLGGGTFWMVSSGVVGRAIAAHETNLANANALPLELLSLRYASDTAGFVVTGLVQNPAKSIALRGVVAVVYLFDGEGKYIASSRASLESGVLSPGGESGFVVRLPAATDVSKYRVSFQHDDGAAVTHVDRRGALPENTTGDAVGSAVDRSALSSTVVRK